MSKVPLGWYIKRLSSMSAPELAHRVREQARRQVSKRKAYGWIAFDLGDGPAPALPGLGEAIKANARPELREAIGAAARKLLDGRFEALGVSWPQRARSDLFPPELWRLDPVTGGQWPGAEAFTYAIPYRHERTLGDVKYVWEMNRLQWLQPLAAAWALEGDQDALAALEAAIQSWVRHNPPFRGIGWNSGIEIGLRAVSVLVVGSLCGDALSVETRRALRSLLAASLYWSSRYPSGFSSANNHLIAEAMGEYLIGLALPEANGAGEALRHAAKVLEREAALQILADGIGAEQSPTYTAFSAEMLALCAFAGRAAGKPLAPVVEERLAAFAEAIGWLADAAGRTPAIGDDDEGRVLTLCSGHEACYPASVAAACAGLLGRVETLASPIAPAELRDAVFATPGKASASPKGRRTFADGGYSVVRERRGGRELQLILDHGPLGYLSIAAHGHADAGMVLLSIDGRPVLVDPGTYLYHSGGAWRDAFRGTRAHNTLAVGGEDQSLISGAFNWSHKARAELVEADTGPDWAFTVRHDGYRGRAGVDHVRRVSARADGVEILDRLEPYRDHPVEAGFQLAPGLEATGEGLSRVISDGGRPLLEISFEAAGTVAALSGGEAGAGGWVSPAFGSKVPAVRIAWSGAMPEQGLRTRLRLL